MITAKLKSIREPFHSLALRREKQMQSAGSPVSLGPRPGVLLDSFNWSHTPAGVEMWDYLHEEKRPLVRHFQKVERLEVEHYKLRWVALINLSPIGGPVTEAHIGEGIVPGMTSVEGGDESYTLIAVTAEKWYGQAEFEISSVRQYIPKPDIYIRL